MRGTSFEKINHLKIRNWSKWSALAVEGIHVWFSILFFFFFARNCAVLHICRACGRAIRRQSSLVIESYLSRNQLTVELLVT